MKQRQFELRASDAGDRTIEVTASTATVDDYGTILRAWDLTRFERNPVVLWNHDRSSMPIGSATNIRMDGDALKMRIQIVSVAAHPSADLVWNGIREKSIRGVSVGFMPSPRTKITTATVAGRTVDVIEGLELYEVSIVALPSNPEALIEQVRSALGSARDAFYAALPAAERREWARGFFEHAPTHSGAAARLLGISEGEARALREEVRAEDWIARSMGARALEAGR